MLSSVLGGANEGRSKGRENRARGRKAVKEGERELGKKKVRTPKVI